MALALLGYALKLFHDSFRENTNALTELKTVIEKQTEREKAFIDVIYPLAKDTNERVRAIEIEVRK